MRRITIRMNIMGASLVVVALAALAPVGGAVAGEFNQSIFVTGFVSQGYLNTSENNYLVPRSINGTAEFTEAAVTVVARPADRLRVGIQFLARNFGHEGNDYTTVDWAYGDYRWRDWFGVRLGKVKMPFGFYNEGRDVDMLRTTALMPQSIYNEALRDFILAYEGIGGYGNFSLGGMGDADYHLYGGTLNVPNSGSGFWGGIYRDLGEGVESEIGDQLGGTATFASHSDEVVSFPWIYGGALNWNTPLEGLRFGASAMQGRYNMQGRLRYDVFVDQPDPNAAPVYMPLTADLDLTFKIHHIAVLGAEYLQDRWSLAAEYYHENMDGNTGYGWYVQGDWQLGRRWALATYYADTRPGATSQIEDDTPSYYSWQKDLTVSVRVDLTDHWLFKLEKHFIDGVASAQRADIVDFSDSPLQKSWGMLVAKTTFHF